MMVQDLNIHDQYKYSAHDI